MTINERRIGDVVVLDFVGPLSGWQAAGVVEDTVRRHGREGVHTVVANLAQVPTVDCGGLGALVDAYKAMRESGGEMRLAGVTRRIHDLLVITRLLTVFDTFDSVEQAIEGAIPAFVRGADSPRPSAPSSGMMPHFLRRA
jgi:anti-sigma B factor antagonist